MLGNAPLDKRINDDDIGHHAKAEATRYKLVLPLPARKMVQSSAMLKDRRACLTAMPVYGHTAAADRALGHINSFSTKGNLLHMRCLFSNAFFFLGK